MATIKIAVITVSDSCSAGENEDLSGPYLLKAVQKTFTNSIVHYTLIRDDVDHIKTKLIHYSDELSCNLIITTGGTGFTKRDVTPEATREVIQKQAPSISTIMCVKSVEITQMAMLSRSVCGIRNETLIINLPGSLKAVKECYEIIEKVLPHAIDQITGETCRIKKVHTEIQTNKSHCCSHKHSNTDNVAYRNRQSTYPMIDVDDALKMIVDSSSDSLEKALNPIRIGQVCLEDVKAPESYPPFPASIKDGYVCISSDGKGLRKVKSSVTAGELNDAILMKGECIRISTGAPVPAGGDCVVQVEDTKLLKHSEDGKVEYEIEIMSSPKPGQDIRQIGSDITKGDVILHKNSYIGSAEFGLLHSFGIESILSTRKLRIGVLSTGNELKDSNDALKEGCIRDSNRPMLISLLSDYADCIDLGIVRDERDYLFKMLQTAFNVKHCDVIVTSGGVSMGEKDLLKHVLMEELSFKILFGRVNMKPGKPTTFATGLLNSTKKFVFGLPGNPVSAYVTCNLFVIPALRALMGLKEYSWPRINVELNEDVVLDPRPEYARATIKLEKDKILPVATLTGNQISSRLPSLVGAQILLELPSSLKKGNHLPKGSIVSALFIKNI